MLDIIIIISIFIDLLLGKYKLSKEHFEKMTSFKAYSINQRETLSLIKSCYDDNKYLIDPHTAVAYGAYQKHQSEYHTLIISTASPYKFADTIKPIH